MPFLMRFLCLLKYKDLVLLLAFVVIIVSFGCTHRQQSLHVFAGAAAKPAITEVANLFEQNYGVKVEVTYGSSGEVLSQILISQTGDVYIPGSDDYMNKAEDKGVIIKDTRRIICYLKPVIVVQKGNPKKIHCLKDLTQPGIKIAIGVPQAVCLGDIAYQIFRKAGITNRIKNNIITYAHNCEHLLTLVKLKQVDAIIGWDFYENLAKAEVETISLPEEIANLRNIPVAVVSFSKQRRLADTFVHFISDSNGKEVFKRYGYNVELKTY